MSPSYGWLDLWHLGKSCGRFHLATDSSSSNWTWISADSVLRLTSVLVTGLDLGLTYAVIYRVNISIYFPKYIIFMITFLATNFSWHWFKLWQLLQKTWRSLKKLEEASRNFKNVAGTDSSFRGWLKLRWLMANVSIPPNDVLPTHTKRILTPSSNS